MPYRLRKMLAAGVCLLLVLTAFSGCATLEENPRTTTGAAVGAVGGAVIGGVAFKSTTGAVVGGLLGGLAGGLIGNAMENKRRSYDETSRDYNYNPAQGTVIRIEKVDIDPASVRPGERVNLIVQYALLTPDPNQTVTVNERWNLNRGNQFAGNPVNTVQRESGTWASAIPVMLPRNAAPGTYRATVTIEVGDEARNNTKTFTVR